MKRLICIVCIICSLTVFASCSDNKNTGKETDGSEMGITTDNGRTDGTSVTDTESEGSKEQSASEPCEDEGNVIEETDEWNGPTIPA